MVILIHVIQQVRAASGTVSGCDDVPPSLVNTARNNTTFTIGAIASIGGAETDQWTMNQTKNHKKCTKWG